MLNAHPLAHYAHYYNVDEEVNVRKDRIKDLRDDYHRRLKRVCLSEMRAADMVDEYMNYTTKDELFDVVVDAFAKSIQVSILSCAVYVFSLCIFSCVLIVTSM